MSLLKELLEGKAEKLSGEIKTFTNEWKSIVGEEGDKASKEMFKNLLQRAKKMGLKVTNKYPDGKPIR